MVLLGCTFCVDESFIKGKELINTNSSQNFLNNTLPGNSTQPSWILESLAAHTMINEQISDRARVKTKDEPRQSSHRGKWIEQSVSANTQPTTRGRLISSSCKQISCCRINSTQYWEGSRCNTTIVCFKLLLKYDVTTVVMSSHQLDLSVLQGRNRNEGRSCQQCVPQDSSAHTRGTVSLWPADKGKGFLCKAGNEPIVTGQSKVLHGKSQHSWGHKAVQAHEWIPKDEEHCTVISLLLKCSQVWAGRSCLACTNLRNKQAASAPMAAALQPPRQHWICFLGDKRHLKSQLHKRQKNNSYVCVGTHVHTWCTCRHRSMIFKQFFLLCQHQPSTVALPAPQSPLFGRYLKSPALIKL